MKVLPFKKIDAFTNGTSSGNPAGYITMNPSELLSLAEMQQIAVELKGFVNEVGYVCRLPDRVKLQFYSSECEVAFCGHALIAIMNDLLRNDPVLNAQKEVAIEVGAGPLTVFNDLSETDAVYIMAPEPQFLPCPVNVDEVVAALGTVADEIHSGYPIRLIDGGLRTLLVPMKTLNGCLKLFPHQESLRQFCLGHGIDIIHVSVEETVCSNSQYRTRVFAPKYGYLEDPATGSGNSAFGYYLIDENRWNSDMTIEQGASRDNPNFVKLKRYTSDGKSRMLFGGGATTRIDGVYQLHSVSV